MNYAHFKVYLFCLAHGFDILCIIRKSQVNFLMKNGLPDLRDIYTEMMIKLRIQTVNNNLNHIK